LNEIENEERAAAQTDDTSAEAQENGSGSAQE
jgi:hypothetical protein